MKNHPRHIATQLVALLFLFTACQERDTHQFTDVGTPVPSADLQAKIHEILIESDRLDRIAKLVPVLRGITADQAHLLRDVLSARRLPYRDVESILIASVWAKYDPPAAAKWAIHMERVRSIQEPMTADVIRIWATRNPALVMQSYQVVGRSTPAVLVGLIEGWFESGQPGLESFVREIPHDNDRQTAISQLIRLKFAKAGSDGMTEWAESQTGGKKYRALVYANVAAELVAVAPERAVQWCDAVCDTREGKYMRDRIAIRWSADSGADAMDWILTQPDSVGMQGSGRAAYRQFLIHAKPEAYVWMEATTLDQRQTAVVQGPLSMYVNNRAWTDPEIAIKWTEYLTSESEREQALVMIARRWLKAADKGPAEAWLSQSTLSEEAREAARSGSRSALASQIEQKNKATERRRARAAQAVVGKKVEVR
jgi:hypothetical protein